MEPEEIRVEALHAAIEFVAEGVLVDDVLSIAREFEMYILEG